MKHLRPYALYESLVDKKIQLLKDLSLELQDAGLQVDIINGSKSYLLRDPRVSIHTGSRYTDDYKKFIILKVTDDNEIFDTDLYNTDLIDDFKQTLKSYGMNPRAMSGGRNFCVFKFDKHGSMTNSPIIRESISKDTKDYLSDIEISLNDIKLKITYQDQIDSIVMYINGGVGVYFTLSQVREEINHIISFMEGSNHTLLSVRYMLHPKRYWINMYDSNNVNRWGNQQQKEDIFDIQDKDLTKDIILSFELKFSN